MNVLSLVPNGQLRIATLGVADRPADARELAEMQELLRESLDAGAWGYSTGLEYAQEQAASEEELTALAAKAPFYATHTRRRDDGAADAVAEAIRTGDRAGVRLQVSHLVPRNGIEESRRCIDLVETAQGRGQDVAFDMHTRTFGLTNLYAALPAWALAADTQELEAILARSGEARRDAHAPLDPERGQRLVARRAARQRGVARVRAPRSRVDRGRARAGAARRGVRPAARRPRRAGEADGDHPRVQRGAAARGVRASALRPGLGCDDARARRRLAHAFFHGAYTWAAWFWRFMVRDEGLLTPEDAIHRLTGQPAERIGLSDRGVLREGARADVVVFDPARFGERGTVYEPNLLAEGMEHVVVNGVPTLRDGRLTGDRGGMVVRR